MSIKFFCDICKKECTDPEFVFDGTIMEVKEIFDLTNQKLNAPSQKQMQKRQIQICKTCFKDKIETLL